MHPYQRFSSWLLVILGSVLLVSGTIGLVDAIVHRSWGAAVVTLLLMLVIGFGTARGLRQLRHRDR